MKPLAICIFFAATLLAVNDGAAQDANDKARAKLIGTWAGFAVDGKGENPDKGPVKIELIITKETIKGIGFKGKERTDLGTGTFDIKLDKTPFFLDGDKMTGNPNRKEVWLGIYQLDGDTLKWCVGRKKRPTEFETGGGAFLLILKRQKQ